MSSSSGRKISDEKRFVLALSVKVSVGTLLGVVPVASRVE